MKNFLLFVLLMSVLTIKAQVPTAYFEGKDAFKAMPVLKQTRAQALSAKKMPPVDVEKFLEEDRELEGLDYPFSTE